MSTFSNQSSLPRLPIPSLAQSTSLYLRSIQPLQTPAQQKHTQSLITEFIKPSGLGEKLQARLMARDALEKYSWLEELWFKLAYHSWRESNLVNSNWFMMCKNHPLYYIYIQIS
jgi:carnitine O-acetyltransferase